MHHGTVRQRITLGAQHAVGLSLKGLWQGRDHKYGHGGIAWHTRRVLYHLLLPLALVARLRGPATLLGAPSIRHSDGDGNNLLTPW